MAEPQQSIVLLTSAGGRSAEQIIEYWRAELANVGAELRVVSCKTPEDIATHGKDAAVVIHPGYMPLPRHVIGQLEKCMGIMATKVGTDNIDVPAATEKGIIVANLPDGWTNEVADQAMGLLLAVNRQIVNMSNGTKRGEWPFRALWNNVPLALRRMTLGVLGLGRIGRQMTVRAKAFGMTVIACDPLIERSVFAACGVEAVEFEELLRRADALSLHAPMTDRTQHIINEQTLRLMQPHAVVINTARGGLIDEAALARALREGWIAGAGLDVLEKEPCDPANPLLAMDNVVLTPHTCGLSTAADDERRVKPIADVIRILRGLPPRPEAFVNRDLWVRTGARERSGAW